MRRAGFRALLLALGLQLAVGSGACAAGPDRAAELRAGYQGRTVALEGTDVRPSRPWFRHAFAPTRILHGGEDR